MPHALTPRQSEYLEFIREYIKANESSPRLEEIANHFNVTSPTAHNTLKALMRAGYIHFGRSSTSGFFIRLIERAGSAETVHEIPIAGKVDRYGELIEFPQKHGHFATLLLGGTSGEIFALTAWEDIPEVSVLAGDLLICDYGKHPQAGDFVIVPFGFQGQRYFLCEIFSLTMDKEMPNIEVANPFPITENLLDKELGQQFHWAPLAYTEKNDEYFRKVAEETKTPLKAIPPEYVVATVLRLARNLAF